MKRFTLLALLLVLAPAIAQGADPDSNLYKWSKGYAAWASTQAKITGLVLDPGDTFDIYPEYGNNATVRRSGIFSHQMSLTSTQASIDVTAALEVILAPPETITYAEWDNANETTGTYDSRTTTGVWTIRAEAEIPGWAIRLHGRNNGDEQVTILWSLFGMY